MLKYNIRNNIPARSRRQSGIYKLELYYYYYYYYYHHHHHPIYIFHSCLFPCGFPTKILYAIHFILNVSYIPCASHSPWLDHFNFTWRRVMKLLIMQFSPTAFHLDQNVVFSTLLSNIFSLPYSSVNNIRTYRLLTLLLATINRYVCRQLDM
jgi:hypothetical protein